MACEHTVSIHDPCHNLTVCINIRSRDIFIRADDRKDPGCITTGQTDQLSSGKFGRIDLDTSFGTAVRNIYNCTFKGHPCSKSLNLVHVGILMEADTTFARSTCTGMLNTISLKYLDGAIIHTDRDRNLKLTFRVAKCCVIFITETQCLCRLF